jgi:hypothetical protein
MLQAILRLSSVGLVSDQLGQPQRRQDMTHPRHAPVNCSRNLTGGELFIITEYIDDGESQRIAQETAQARLPVDLFFHGVSLAHVCSIAQIRKHR